MLQIVSHTDSSLNWLGRWIDNDGKYSGWGGSSLQFKFTGTQLSIEVDVHNYGGINAMIDDYTNDWTHKIPLHKDGINTITVVSGLENKEHTAQFRFWSDNYKNKYKGIDYVKIKNILIDNDAKILKWSENLKLGYFGDSWASAGNDFTRFLKLDGIEIHSISETGLKSYNGVKRYPYVMGSTLIKDIPFDGIVIGYGINDAHRYIFNSTTIFKRNILKLIDKIRENDFYAKIFLLQSPRNHSAKGNTSKYGNVLKEIAKERSNCFYISSKDIENQLTWMVDGSHLDTKGKHVYGNWLGEKLQNYLC